MIELDDWVPAVEFPPRLVDEFYCSQLNMPLPSLDMDDDSDLDETDDYTPYVPLSQKQIKRQLRETGCYRKVRKPGASLPQTPKSRGNCAISSRSVDFRECLGTGCVARSTFVTFEFVKCKTTELP